MMLDRDVMLATIHQAYAARARGDKRAMAAFWARGPDDGLFFPEQCTDAANSRVAIAAMIDLFEFHAVNLVDAVVDPPRAAMHWHVTVSAAGGEPVETDILDLWRFNDHGKIASLSQFADTALILSMVP